MNFPLDDDSIRPHETACDDRVPDCAEVITLTAGDQLAFCNALNASAALTPAQKRLGLLMRGHEAPNADEDPNQRS